jgi:hypothetical protein
MEKNEKNILKASCSCRTEFLGPDQIPEYPWVEIPSTQCFKCGKYIVFEFIKEPAQLLTAGESMRSIRTQHAHSLIELVKYFKGMIQAGNIPEDENRSDELTSAYCDELMIALGGEAA